MARSEIFSFGRNGSTPRLHSFSRTHGSPAVLARRAVHELVFGKIVSFGVNTSTQWRAFMYLIYGAGKCRLCGLRGANHQIRETQRSRFLAMQLIAEMSADIAFGAQTAPALVMTGANRHKLMVGVLDCGGTIIAACSGHNDHLQPFVRAARRKGYIMAPYRNPPYKTRGGGTISDAELTASHGGGNAPQPGICAAPKLILEAFARGLHANDGWRHWQMSEVFYQPNTTRRTAEMYSGHAAKYDHGVSQYHCITCDKLVPMLMCGNRT